MSATNPGPDPSCVWLIWASQGEYSDRTEWPIAVLHEQASAERATVRLGQLWRQINLTYREREDELDAAEDWDGDTLFDGTPEGREYFALTGSRGGLGSYSAEDRDFTCLEVPVWIAQPQPQSGES